MKARSLARVVASVSLPLLALAGVSGAPAAAPASTPAAGAKEPGELWEVTTRMSMPGMPMAIPPQTHKVCSPKNWSEPPGAKGDDTCEVFDSRSTGSKWTWKVRCAGPPAMTGEGEVSRTAPDAYQGTMKMSSEDGVMTVAMNGRRVGDCDAAAARREREQQVAEAQAMGKAAADAQRQAIQSVCDTAVESMNLGTIHAQASLCDEATVKAGYCRRLETTEGFAKVCPPTAPPGSGLKDAAAFCGTKPETLTDRFCPEALKNEALDLLGACCPKQTQALAEEHCAGRKYTELEGSKYQSFCMTYARDTLADAQKDAKKPESVKDKIKKGFKIPFSH